MLTSLSAPVDLPLDLGGPDLVTRDALSSFLGEFCTDHTFCLDLFNDHAIVPARLICVTIAGMSFAPTC